MNRYIFFVCLFLLFHPAFSQVSMQWQFYQNTPENSGFIFTDSQNNVYTVGGSGMLRKYDHFGNTIFALQDTGIHQNVSDVQLDNNEDIVILSQTYVAPSSEIYIEKYDTSGSRLWILNINTPTGDDEYPRAMTIDSDNNIYISGWDGDQFDGKFYTAKISPAGALLWSNGYQGYDSNPYFGLDIAVYDSNNVYAVGFENENINFTRTLLIKYDDNGDTVWTRKFDYALTFGGIQFSDVGEHIETDQLGYVYILSHCTTLNGYGLLKYDPAGNRLWARQLQVMTHVKSMFLDSSGILLGGGGNGNPMMMRLDTAGNVLDSSSYTTSYFKVKTTCRFKNGIILSGDGEGPTGDDDVITVCFDGSGNVVWDHVMSSALGSFSDEVAAVAVDNANGVYVTGTGNGSFYWMNTYKLYDCNSIQPNIQYTGPDLIANYIPGAMYYWYGCSNDSIVAWGDELNHYTPAYSDYFAVIIDVGTCSDSSSCIMLNASHLSIENSIQIFPNPVLNTLHLHINDPLNSICYIYTIDGRKVKTIEASDTDFDIDVADLSPGVYLINVFTGNETRKFRFVKS